MASILYVVHRSWPYQGGSERYFFEIAKRTAAQGHAVTLVTTDAWDAAHLHFRKRKRIEPLVDHVEGVTIRRFRVRHFFYQQRVLPLLSRLIPTEHPVFDRPHLLVPGLHIWLRWTRQRFDLVHAGVFPHAPLIAAAARYSRRRGVPFVCQPMLNLGEPHRAQNNAQFLNAKLLGLLEPAAAILTNTAYENEVLIEKGVVPDKITVAAPAVDSAQVLGGDGPAFRARYGIDGPMILQVSTQTYDKGSWHTVAATELLRRERRDVTLVMIGAVESDFAKHLDALPGAMREHLRVLDYVPEQEKKDALAACDVFVMPSRADSFGIAYLEAWLYGKAVVGCHAGGVPRVIEDGKDGLLVPFGDSHMLAESIAALLDNRTAAAAMGARGRDKVMTRYQWAQTHDIVQNVYNRCLHPGRHPRSRRALRIGIDISRTIGEPTGVGSYAASLVEGLAQIDDANEYLLYPCFWECFPPDFQSARVPLRSNFRLWANQSSIDALQRQWLGQSPDAAAGDPDIVHSTGFTAPAFARSRLIVTVHDLSFVTHPQFHTEANRTFCLREVQRAADRAAMILVPSRNTKGDLQRHYGVPDDRVVVIPHAADPAFRPVTDGNQIRRVLEHFGIEDDYLLFVGSVEPRKNLAGLVGAAFEWLDAPATRRQLVVAGPPGWLNSDVHQRVRDLELGPVVRFLGYVGRQELRALYSGARAFIYPSFYEGFGFPVLEAMACGAPVITSNTPALEEIAAGAARLVPPDDEDALRRAIHEVTGDDELRARLGRAGLERAACYSWLDTARRTLDVYKLVASGGV